MSTRTNVALAGKAFALFGAASLGALYGCVDNGSQTPPGAQGSGDGGAAATGVADGGSTDGSTTDANPADQGVTDGGDEASGAIPIVSGGSPDVPYQFGPNVYGISGAAFFAKSNYGAETVVLDTTKTGEICVKGTVDTVPTPADGGHPPYSDWWGIDVGFNLNQGGADASAKNPWLVPSNVIGFWFTVQGAAIPAIRFKTTPTGKDPAQEQDSCAIVTPQTDMPNPVPFTDMYVQCWDGPQGTAPTDISKGLLDVSLQVAADINQSYPVDFCWTGFGVITN